MEENDNKETNNEINNSEEKHQCFAKESNCWKKCVVLVLAAMLGGFFATYFVADQIHDKKSAINYHKAEQMMLQDYERMQKRELQEFEKLFRHFPTHRFHEDTFSVPDFMMNPIKVKTDFEDNAYRVIISLKPFQEDESKVTYNVRGHKLTVFGKSHIDEKNHKEDISFSQDFILPDNADIAKISKVKDGDSLVISVPVKE